MKVYEFGARVPQVNLDVIIEQMRLGHRYYNLLVELEHRQRAEYEEIMRSYAEYDTLVELATAVDEDVEAARAEIRAARQRARKNVDTSVLNSHVYALKELRAFTWLLAREAKESAKVAAEPQIAALDAANLARCKEARATCGVYWGTKLIIEDSIEQAKKASRGPIKFRVWRGDGHLSAQLQGGLSLAETCACTDTQFQLLRPPEDTWSRQRADGTVDRTHRRHLQGTLCRIRIASTPTGAPVWTTVPIFMHRDLPADTIIKRVHLLRERIADRDRWKVQITVESAVVKQAPPGHGVVGIDIGWRVVPDGLRVGYTYDSDGCGGPLTLDPRLLSSLTKSSSLRAIRDRLLNELKEALGPAVRALAAGGPADWWFPEAVATMFAWRAPSRFVRLQQQWRTARFAGDELAYLALASWAHQDLHLWQWEKNQWDKAEHRRREQYRIWAAQLADRYETVVLEGRPKDQDNPQEHDKVMDLRPLAERPLTEATEQEAQCDAARHNRVLADTSVLRTCLLQAFQARGRRVCLVPAPGTTQRCHVCGLVEPRTDALVQTGSCGHTWDQDDNAARNLVAVASAAVPGAALTVLATPKYAGSRWKRRKDQKVAKATDLATKGCSQKAPQPPAAD